MTAERRAKDASVQPANLFVDCINSLASMPFDFDDWGIDIAVPASQ